MDQSVDWASQNMDKWYGKAWRQRSNIADIIISARKSDPQALSPLTALIGDSSKAAIIRATAMNLLPNYGNIGVQYSLSSLKDPSPLIRIAALQSVEYLSNKQKTQIAVPLLNDPSLAVRIEVARLLASVPKQQFSDEDAKHLKQALEEYKTAQIARSDHPEGYTNLGNLYKQIGEIEQAKGNYQTAIELDNNFMPAYNGLGQLYYAMGDYEKAETTFLQALEKNQDGANIHYSLALLLIEKKRQVEALAHIEKAAALLPNQARIHYNLGMLLLQLKKISEAEKVLLHANKLAPADRRILQALIVLYQKHGQPSKAKKFIQQLNVSK